MPKRLTKLEKTELIDKFKNGQSIIELSNIFGCTKLTITRNLKNLIGEEQYKEIIKKNKIKKNVYLKDKKVSFIENKDLSKESIDESNLNNQEISEINLKHKLLEENQFHEIVPLDFEIDNSVRQDLTSVPIEELNIQVTFYMIIDKKTELIIKELKDYPEYEFLSQSELNRKTIQIFKDLKVARKCCQKDQKVIKVPNPKVFKIASSILKGKGISRIVTEDKLIAL